MAIVAEFRVAAGAFPLGAIFQRYPEAAVELERVVPTQARVIPYFWVRGVAAEDVEAAFDGHPGAAEVRLVDRVGDEQLLRVTWDPEEDGVLSAIAGTEVTLLSATGNSEEWRFEVRAEASEPIGSFQERCREAGVPIRLTGLHDLSHAQDRTLDLTEAQREALILALERGYYDDPRQATLAEIAEELDITGQSLGSRLQRGTRRLIQQVLVEQ